ncbi:MAG: IS66 family transposase [Planctomycetaceae bacterium]
MSLEITEELIARQPPEAQAIIRLLLAQIAELRAELAALKKTPENSSLPPSAQHPHAKPPRNASKSKRKRGGQQGHNKVERALVPLERCTEVVTCQPRSCRRCGTALAGQDPTPLRHQVWELPEIKPLITEYQRHRLACTACGTSTCGQLPAGVPRGQSGPRLIAFVALLMACFRQSKRRTAQFVSMVLNIPCSAALTVKHQQIATQATRAAYDDLAAALPREPVLYGDESPTKQASERAWLWTFVARRFTVFAVRTSRAATILTDLFDAAYDGVMHCDRAKMYWQLGRLQWCWAHLKRDVQALIDHPDLQLKRLGHDLMRPIQKLFRHWSRCRDGTLTHREMQRLLAPVRREVNALLLRGHGTAAHGMCRELFTHREWLWTFLEVVGVEPTNNAAERALRPAVIWRKLSFGTQSEQGSRFVETLLSVIATCHQQQRDAFTYLTTALKAHFQDQPTPSLLTEV